MTKKQLVIGDLPSDRPYPEDRWPDARISKRNLLAVIRREQAKMLERLADMERRITDNADKAHAKIGSNIAELGAKATSICDQLDVIDDDLKVVKGSVERLSNDLDERQGAV